MPRHRRNDILLAGLPLHTHGILDVIDIASAPKHKRFPLDDWQRNRLLLSAFGDTAERTSSELIAFYSKSHMDWSEHFNTLRTGEALGWALEHGIIERVAGSHVWRLLEREPLFESVGREKRISVRLRGHASDEEAIVAGRIWQRELKRREQHRRRRIKENTPGILRDLESIVRDAPDRRLHVKLERYAVAGINTYGGCQQLIRDSLGEMSIGEIHSISTVLTVESIAAMRDATPPIPADDLQAMGDLL